jgi:hypothetical protein
MSNDVRISVQTYNAAPAAIRKTVAGERFIYMAGVWKKVIFTALLWFLLLPMLAFGQEAIPGAWVPALGIETPPIILAES